MAVGMKRADGARKGCATWAIGERWSGGFGRACDGGGVPLWILSSFLDLQKWSTMDKGSWLREKKTAEALGVPFDHKYPLLIIALAPTSSVLSSTNFVHKILPRTCPKWSKRWGTKGPTNLDLLSLNWIQILSNWIQFGPYKFNQGVHDQIDIFLCQ